MSQLDIFSERENEIIKIIGKGSRTLQQISKSLFQDERAPFDPEITVGNSVRRIIKKCEHHQLAWTLTKKRSDGKMYITKETV